MGAASFLRLPEPRPVVRPEYERTLERALLSFPDASGDTDPAALARFLEVAFRDLRNVLPSYTSVHVAARREPGGFEGARLHRSSVNVVPFFDREAGRKRVLLPVFPGELSEDATVVDRRALGGKAAVAFDLYRDLGYEPSPLRDVTHTLGGNTHCIVNVLS